VSSYQQGDVLSFNATTWNAVVNVGGTSVTARVLCGEVLRVGWVVWVEKRGPRETDWVVTDVHSPAMRTPKAKLVTTNVMNGIGATPTKFDFTAANGGSVDYDYGGMAVLASSRLVVPIDGVYTYGAGVSWGANASGNSTVLLDIKLTPIGGGGAIFLPPRFAGSYDTRTGAATVDDEREFLAGDFIEFFITSMTQTRSFGSASDELGARLWMSYKP
jgi:hypothetical protein